MDFSNDFLGSVAQEDVVFQTQIIRNAVVGDNYFKVMIFVEEDRFIVDDTGAFLVPVPGTGGKIKAGVVSAADFSQFTKGLLQSWLTDLFANSEPYDVYLVTCGKSLPAPSKGTGTVADPYVWENLANQVDVITTPASGTDFAATGTLTLTSVGGTIYYTTDGSDPTEETGTKYAAPIGQLKAGMTIKARAYAAGKAPSKLATIAIAAGAAADKLKATVTQGEAPVINPKDESLALLKQAYSELKPYAYHKTILIGHNDVCVPEYAVALSELCVADKDLLSAAPYLPVSYEVPIEVEEKDPLVAAIRESSGDAFFTYHSDSSRNGSLYSLGLALASTNNSGTPVGNSIDFVSSNMISLPGPDGTALPKTARDFLKGINIATFKSVGDSTGNIVARGIFTYRGDVMQANWIVAYVGYMTKVQIAKLITRMNALKNEATYAQIGRTLQGILNPFGPSGSGRLNPVGLTLPPFAQLPEASGDEYIIPNAWAGTFVHQTHRVQITGSLVIPTAS